MVPVSTNLQPLHNIQGEYPVRDLVIAVLIFSSFRQLKLALQHQPADKMVANGLAFALPCYIRCRTVGRFIEGYLPPILAEANIPMEPVNMEASSVEYRQTYFPSQSHQIE